MDFGEALPICGDHKTSLEDEEFDRVSMVNLLKEMVRRHCVQFLYEFAIPFSIFNCRHLTA